MPRCLVEVQSVKYASVTEKEDIPSVLAGGLVANIGFGVAF